MDLMQCVEQARRGDRFALDELGTWCLQRAFRLAFVELGAVPNRHITAEEIASEAGLQAVTHLHQFRPGTHFPAWLAQITRNCVLQYYRRRDQALPQPIYERWVHAFLQAHGPELQDLIRQEFGAEPSPPHHALFERLRRDLQTKTYLEFLRLFYDGRANVVLLAAKQRLRAFVRQCWAPLHEQDADGDWVEVPLVAAEETQQMAFQRLFVQEVNDELAALQPLCRRLLRWRFLDRLSAGDIAALEQIGRRTVYRTLERCAEGFRARTARNAYLAELLVDRADLAARVH